MGDKQEPYLQYDPNLVELDEHGRIVKTGGMIEIRLNKHSPFEEELLKRNDEQGPQK